MELRALSHQLAARLIAQGAPARDEESSREFSRAAQNARSQVLMLRHGLTGTEGDPWSEAPMTLRQVL